MPIGDEDIAVGGDRNVRGANERAYARLGNSALPSVISTLPSGVSLNT
jgi:hypothetical protein